MPLISSTYSFGKRVNLTKAKKAGLHQLDGDDNFLFTTLGRLFIIIFADGRIRISGVDKNEEAFRRELAYKWMELKALVSAIAKAAAMKVDVDSVLSKQIDEKDVMLERCLVKDSVSASVVRRLSAVTERIMGEYHKERLETQAGEIAGRAFGFKAKSKSELEQLLIKAIRDEGLGIVSLEKVDKEKTERTPYAVFRVLQSAFAYGAPATGRALCNYIRGMIRGAYCSYINGENINVIESRCWGLGDVFCEFRVYLI